VIAFASIAFIHHSRTEDLALLFQILDVLG
jgi:hypothetical protein